MQRYLQLGHFTAEELASKCLDLYQVLQAAVYRTLRELLESGGVRLTALIQRKGSYMRIMVFQVIMTLILGFGFMGVAWADKPIIVASTTQIADMTRHIVGDSMEVLSILEPGADPHTYTPVPADVRKAMSAQLVIRNGLHLEGKDWIGTLARDANKPIVTAADGIAALELDQHGEKVADPHAWFSTKNAAVYTNNILKALVDHFPQHKASFQARARLFLEQLRVLDIWIRERVNSIPPDQRVLVTNHDAFNYFSKEYGFKNQAPVGWSTGQEVGGGTTPERRREVVEAIRKQRIRALFIETTINPKMIMELAQEAGVIVGGSLYSDSMGAAGTAGETYIGMMRENVITIVNALGTKE